MLQLSSALVNRPIMSLRTGGEIAVALSPIINPNNLKIEGWYCQDRFDKKARLVLLPQDVRDILPQGIVVNDHDVLSEPAELIRLKPVMDLRFELIGKPVVTTGKSRLGKVSDYAVEVETLYIQKFYVAQPLIKSLSGGSLSVSRDQIVEITSRKIVIQEPLQPQPVQNRVTAPVPAPATQ